MLPFQSYLQFIFHKLLKCHWQPKKSTTFSEIFKAVTVFEICERCLIVA